ncbi:anthranilate phosphoribosyltransferase [Candidatus Marinimicrobia bacterium MT.SAG.2]|nr:anthranilate phosphoribosyltransferase [Candidatus Marinimicrobia bacterium MT.SAG.2]
MIQTYLSKLIGGASLSRREANEAMNSIMSGETPATQIAAFLVAMRMKGENSEEVTGFVESMRSNATPVAADAEPILDMCGTGGDGAGTFNISTIASLIVAAGGITVAKHGNRAVSSKCGSADLFSALGVNIEMPVERLSDCLNEIGYAFLFAPLLHPAMKHAVGPRRELKIRTVFNLLGPMTNPANPTLQLLGIYDFELAELVAEVLRNIGVKRAFVVHGSDGLDEVTLTGTTMCVELDGDDLSRLDLTPESFGLPQLSTDDISGDFEPEECGVIATKIFSGEKGAKRDIVVANAAIGLYLGGKEDTIEKAARLAEKLLDGGEALKLLENFREFTKRA